MDKIVVLQLKQVEKQLKEHQITLEVTKNAQDWLANEGYSPAYGARPLKRVMIKMNDVMKQVIQHEVLNPLAKKLLAGDIRDETSVVIDENKGVNKEEEPLTFAITRHESKEEQD